MDAMKSVRTENEADKRTAFNGGPAEEDKWVHIPYDRTKNRADAEIWSSWHWFTGTSGADGSKAVVVGELPEGVREALGRDRNTRQFMDAKLVVDESAFVFML